MGFRLGPRRQLHFFIWRVSHLCRCPLSASIPLHTCVHLIAGVPHVQVFSRCVVSPMSGVPYVHAPKCAGVTNAGGGAGRIWPGGCGFLPWRVGRLPLTGGGARRGRLLEVGPVYNQLIMS